MWTLASQTYSVSIEYTSLDLHLIHLFALELAQIMFALVCAFMRSNGGFMRSFCGFGCVGMRHYAPVCGPMRSFAFRAQICVSKDAPGGLHYNTKIHTLCVDVGVTTL